MSMLRIVASSAVLALSLAALSRAPYSPPGTDDAMLRFSWRMNVAPRENCRARTQPELEALPVHMRTPEVCTPDDARYLLVTRVGDAPPDTVHLSRGGVKGDRPLFVLEERSLPAGRHRLRVRTERVTAAGTDTTASLSTMATLRAGRIQLVTLDAEDRLELRFSRPAPDEPLQSRR